MDKGFFHPSRGYWQTTGEVPDYILAGYPEGTQEVPLKPAYGYEWDGHQWVSEAVDTTSAKEQERANAIVSKGAFCSALMKAGILSIPEAVSAAKGDWPQSFATFTASLPETVAAEAQIKWAAAVEVHYTDPLLQTLALRVSGDSAVAATALLDSLFGLEVSP